MRSVITVADIDNVVVEFRQQLLRRIGRKGDRCLISRHEILGVVAEEYKELTDAVQSESLDRVRSEAWDVAVAAVVGVVSIDGGVEW
jgi:NTP pyrophosphatase (non-canonical NTP hydrolase)